MEEEKEKIQEEIKKYKRINRNLKIVFWIILLVVISVTSWVLYKMYWSPDNAISQMCIVPKN